MNCIRIKRIIDEADRPDVFPLEAAGHLTGCPECQNFADERAKLRELTGSMSRVTAPGNFNALLNERLSRVKSQKSSWLSPAGFLRVGAATAALLVVFVTLQYGGFLSTRAPKGTEPAAALEGGGPPGNESVKSPTIADGGTAAGESSTVASKPEGPPARTVKQPSKANNLVASRATKDSRQDGPPFLLVRDNNGDFELPMIPVSVGGQQQFRNASYGRQQPRSSDISY